MSTKKVLVAVEDELSRRDLAKVISERCWPKDVQFRIAHIVELVPIGELPASFWQQREFNITTKKKILKRIADELECSMPGSVVAAELIEGVPAQEILRIAQEWEPDLIVVGSHGRTGIRRILEGSVSQAVGSRAKCSVLIVKNSSTDEALSGPH